MPFGATSVITIIWWRLLFSPILSGENNDIKRISTTENEQAPGQCIDTDTKV